MGLVYAPQTTGKGATSGNFRFINNPRLLGFGGGAGAIRKGAVYGYRFAKTHYKLVTGLSSIGVGAGVANLVGSSDSKFPEALSSGKFTNGRSRYGYKSNNRKCKCKPKFFKRNQRRKYRKSRMGRTVVYR